jgi:glucoamylase
LSTMSSMAGVGGLFPEQIWDAEDIPKYTLYNGHSTGAAKPLVWAHAEYITLLRSIKNNEVFGMPPQTVKRYLKDKVRSSIALWRFKHRITKMPKGKKLRIQSNEMCKVRWTIDDWKTAHEEDMQAEPNLHIYFLDLPMERLNSGTKIEFTFFWTLLQKWEGTNYNVDIV